MLSINASQAAVKYRLNIFHNNIVRSTIEGGVCEAAICFSIIPCIVFCDKSFFSVHFICFNCQYSWMRFCYSSFCARISSKPFYLPLGSAIAPHGYLVLFPSMFSGTLINTTIRLVIAGVIIDQTSIPSLPVDQSYARISDGSNAWEITNTPTIDASNNMSQPGQLASPTVSSSNQGSAGSEYPNPTSTPVQTIPTQTTWKSLQFPTPVAIETPATKPAIPYTSALSSPANNGWDTSHRIIITTLIVTLALMLFWCWRLFTHS